MHIYILFNTRHNLILISKTPNKKYPISCNNKLHSYIYQPLEVNQSSVQPWQTPRAKWKPQMSLPI